MSVINANPLMLGDAGYNIGRSLRFRSSASAYLSRTPASAGNRQIWTYSAWFKRGILSVDMLLLDSGVDGNNESAIWLNASNQLDIYNYTGAVYRLRKVTSAVLRDPAAWNHLVVSSNSSTSFKIYLNGVEVTAFSTNTGTNGFDWFFNSSSYAMRIGSRFNSTNFFDGYLAEINFIDGQALTPSSFGQTDAVTGVWTPKKYTGTYGTNGFYLPFSDNTSATTLAYDKSGNGNNWTPNNISTTAGSTYDSMLDVPTLTSATAANYATCNPVNTAGVSGAGWSLKDGNLTLVSGTTTSLDMNIPPTMPCIIGGKTYAEFTCSNNAYAPAMQCGVLTDTNTSSRWISNGSSSPAGISTTFTTGDVIGIAYDDSTKAVSFYKNGTSVGTLSNTLTGNAYFYANGTGNAGATSSWVANFGQRPFSYTPPTGFKALNTFNLPDPTIKKPNQYMDATTYTGTGAARSVTNAGGFQPDLVWMKDRTNAYGHVLQDSIRGATKYLASNTTDAEATNIQTLTSFNYNGFSVGTSAGVNSNTDSYVGWQWKKGATPGFDIVTYTGTGVTRTVSHSLGVVPAMIIVKRRDAGASNWYVYHTSIGNTAALGLNLTDAKITSANFWNNTSPTSSVFTVSGASTELNGSGGTYVAYLFSEIAGFSKFGSYTGNGSTDGPFVYCGFRPKFVMIKMSSSNNDWIIHDTSRDTYNLAVAELYPNSSTSESTTGTYAGMDILSNGFKIRVSHSESNTNTATYIYAAFAENPTKYALAR